jgi:hypothetical protein
MISISSPGINTGKLEGSPPRLVQRIPLFLCQSRLGERFNSGLGVKNHSSAQRVSKLDTLQNDGFKKYARIIQCPYNAIFNTAEAQSCKVSPLGEYILDQP